MTRAQKQRTKYVGREWAVMVAVLLGTGWGLSRTLPAKAGTVPVIPQEVTARAQIALINMDKIYKVMQQYADDFRRRYQWPKRLSALYPDYTDDPSLFWHPGDSQPAPKMITNDEPNALDSTQISYEIIYDPNDPNAGLTIRDWSSDNNDGYFVIEYDSICGETTIPPGVLPVKYPTVLAQKRLRQLGIVMQQYETDMGKFPRSPLTFSEAGYIRCPRLLWNPGDSDPQPTDLMTDEPDTPNSVQVSFLFMQSDAGPNLPPDSILWQDSSPANNGGAGINVCLADGSVRFLPIYDYNDIDGDRYIGQEDFDRFVACMAGPEQIVTDDFCRHFDADQDDDVDMAAMADFALFFGSSTIP